jgi:hypothetical protein
MAGDFTANPLGITKQQGKIPETFELYQNYPNPFNPSTSIKFDIPARTFVNLTVTDAVGREIAEIVKSELEPGTYEAVWDMSNNSGGIYFYTLTAGTFQLTRKMILVK